MSGGEPSSIKQKPSCAADLPILSPKCGKAAGCVYSNYLCAVLWGAERISIETTLSIEGDMPSLRLGQIPAGQKFLQMVETFAPSCIKTHAHVAGFVAAHAPLIASRRVTAAVCGRDQWLGFSVKNLPCGYVLQAKRIFLPR